MGDAYGRGAALLYHHTHTPASNEAEREVRGREVANHQGDYAAMRAALPADIDLVAVRTEHWVTDEAFYDDLEEELEDAYGAVVERYETHIHADTGEGRLTVINGVETALEEEHQHVTLGGLPIEDATYDVMDRAELYEHAKDAAWTAPAHPKLPSFVWDDALLDDLFTDADREGFTAAINYSTGYTPWMNRFARGTMLPHTRSVHDYVAEYGLGLLPEIDLHATFPEKGSGAGLLDPGTVDRLAVGEIPVDDLLSPRIVSYGCEGMSNADFLRSYPEVPSMLPGYTRTVRRLFPADAETFRTARDHSIASLEETSSEALWENARDPTRG